MKIEEANISHLNVISNLAEEIWWPTYKGVISDAQITFMLNQIYSLNALEQQMKNGCVFFLLKSEDGYQGFAAYSKMDIDKSYKLEKLYLKPSLQGKGAGKFLINSVENRVSDLGAIYLYLNVHRGNKAQNFYKKLGYEIVEEIDIPYFDFVLNDYVMRKSIV